MGGILKSLECDPVLINTEPDHAHVLFTLSRTIALAKAVGELKKGSTIWIKNQGHGFAPFHWQSGYGAFSVSESGLPAVISYIRNQEEHHRKFSFQDEFRKLCTAYNIKWDERYVWD
jgi:REP element-mobilizing transposase RayT